MKKRIVALLLCCVMLLTLSPSLIASASAEDVTTPAQTEVTVSPAKANLPRNKKVTLTAQAKDAKSYQWQIMAEDDLWVDISGETESTIQVSYAMVASLLNGGKAQLRCKTDLGTTDPAAVTVTEAQAVAAAPAKAAPKAGTVVKEAEAIGSAVVQDGEGDVVNDETVTPGETTGDEPDTYTIMINYVFEDGKQAANPWTATVAKGSSYAQDVTSPTVLGYAPDQATVSVDVKDAQKDTTYTVTYKPAEVDFTVKHYQQNLNDDLYTLKDTESKKNFTDSPVGGNLAKSYEGFTALLYDTTTKIAADGSTVVEIYYDRNYYLLSFDLDGGYGVEPIYARYGSKIEVDETALNKAGYAFAGWQKAEPTQIDNAALPATMPAENSKYKAKWTVGTADFTVVFWYENADDTNYSYAGSVKMSGNPGDTITSGTYKDERFENRDNTHFTYNSEKTETKTVNGDGSTVLNVYYTRNTYTLTFKNAKITTTCGLEEHEHTYSDRKWYGYPDWEYRYKGGCYPDNDYSTTRICGKEAHTHNRNCNVKYSDLTITAKWNAKISDEFSKAPFTTTYNGRAWECTDSNKYGYPLQTLDRMPGFDATFNLYNKSSNTKKTIYYYVQKVGTTVNSNTWPTSNTNFDLLKQVDTYFNYATYEEEYHEIQGFERYAKNISFNETYQGTGGVKNFRNNTLNLYYLRKNYNLKFYNHDAFVADREATVQYEASLSNYYFEPTYPSGLEPNAYKFAGWYTSDGCYDGSEVNWDTMTMPASDVTLYAKWVPVTHTVKAWLTKDAMESNKAPIDDWTVPHGAMVDPAPDAPENGKYTFVGWFYMDNGVEKAFDFSMPVNKDLDLYAKWNANTLVTYTIKYAVKNEDDTLTYIADETTGSALADTTKTFEAKTGTQLNEGYQTGYFPETGSHSITMDINGNNEFTFIYVPMKKVNYTVRYLEKGTNAVLHKEKTAETSDAVITEKFVAITGYAPDAYQKRLVLGIDADENVITFWYVKDDEHAPVQVIHWTQNIVGDGYTEYQSSTDLNAELKKNQTSTALTIPGFTYVKGTAVAGETTKEFTAPSTPNATLTSDGLVLNLYYDRIEYPYEFRFLEQGTDKKLAEPVTGTARYQAQVTQTAKTIPGYTLASAENQAINIAIEDPADAANKNVRTFYYTEQEVTINYQVVGPKDCGTVDPTSETVKVITGTPKGSTPTANSGFKFVGWYKDEACTQPVDTDWVDANNKLTPGKTVNLGKDKDGNDIMGYEAAIYYAKFEYDVTDLTIIKTYNNMLDPNQSAVFTVTDNAGFSIDVVIHGNGRVVIKGLKVGTTYTVTEKTWTWRYTTAPTSPNSRSIQLVDGEGNNTITFTNTLTKNKWLTGGAWCDNVWGAKEPNKSSSPNYSGK